MYFGDLIHYFPNQHQHICQCLFIIFNTLTYIPILYLSFLLHILILAFKQMLSLANFSRIYRAVARPGGNYDSVMLSRYSINVPLANRSHFIHSSISGVGGSSVSTLLAPSILKLVYLVLLSVRVHYIMVVSDGISCA